MIVMKILHVSPIYPFPPVLANQKDIAGRLMLFRELGYEVRSFSYPFPWQKFDVGGDEKKYGIKISILERGFTYDTFKSRLFSYCYRARPLLNSNAIKTLVEYVRRNKPSVIWLEYSSLSPIAIILKEVTDAKIIIRAHNFELQHCWEKEWTNIKEKKMELFQFPSFLKTLLGVLSTERLMIKIADKVACISKEDQKLYDKYFRSENTVYLPFYPPDKISRHKVRKRKRPLNVFYMGSDFRNNVNRHGALYILHKILPTVQRKHPGKFVFHILGRHGLEQFSSSASEVVRVHDYIEDLNGFLEDMDVALLPVFYGTGFKIKTYECLKRGFPTIGSSRAFRGFNGIDGEHFLKADTPEAFADKLGKLMSADIKLELSVNASKLIQKDFSKEYVKKQLVKIIES